MGAGWRARMRREAVPGQSNSGGARNSLSGLNASAHMARSCPLSSMVFSRGCLISCKRMIRSFPPEARSLPSELKATAVTLSS